MTCRLLKLVLVTSLFFFPAIPAFPAFRSGEIGGPTGNPGADATPTRQISFTFTSDSVGGEVKTVRIPYSATILSWSGIVDGQTPTNSTASIELNQKASTPVTVTDTICASACPAITASTTGTGSIATWGTAITAGDYVQARLKPSGLDLHGDVTFNVVIQALP